MLNNFQLGQFKFYLQPLEKISLPPYAGSTLRGGFGYAFKKVACTIKNKQCEDCLLKDKCPYCYIFKTPVPKSSERMRKYPYAPHPFLITPPLNHPGIFSDDDHIIFELTLIGKAIDFLPYFIYAFEVLGEIGIGKRKGHYKLEKVVSLNETEKEIYSAQDRVLKGDFPIIQADALPITSISHNKLTLRFLTPTRIKYSGKYVKELQFYMLLSNLLRRISSISYFHCNQPLELNFKGLISRAKEVDSVKQNLQWYDWERYSSSQGKILKMGGFRGEITFAGKLKEFTPFLILGGYIHVGKGTSFGLGKYQIIQ